MRAELTADSNVQPTVTTKQSKQLRYYYRHKIERLRYQRDYYKRNKSTILINKSHRDLLNKVKRTKNNDRLIHEIYNNTYTLLKHSDRALFRKAFFHGHGYKPRPKANTINYLWFHIVPELGIVDRSFKPFAVLNRNCKRNDVITAHRLTCELAHFLGFQIGDSIVWKEYHSYYNRIWGKIVTNYNKLETHFVSFDTGSGLDISHPNDLTKLVEMRVKTGLKGSDLAIMFANKYSKNRYLQMWRGNRLISTTETKNALKDYRKYYPFDPQKEFEQKIEHELNLAWKYYQKEAF
jgi:hypothetical protein